MPNALTDSYQLVRTSTLEANFIQRLLHNVNVGNRDGFSLELFRNGSYVRSIRASTDTTAARQGDTLLAVNLGIITVPLTDKVRTADAGDYFIAYDATVRLMVRDAHRFAIGYVQGIDPLQKTVDVILAALKGYIAQSQHDDVSEKSLRDVVKKNTGTVQSFETPSVGIEYVTLVEAFGVAILDAQTMSPRPDPKRVEEWEAAQRVARAKKTLSEDEEIRLATIKQQDTIQTHQHQLDIHKKNDDIALDRIQSDYDEKKRADEALGTAATAMKIQFMQRQFDEGWALLTRLRNKGFSDATIVQDYPGLAPFMDTNNFLAGGNQPGGPVLPQPSSPVVEARAPRKYTVTFSNDICTIEHLGITVSRYDLSEHEAELAGASARALSYHVEEILAPEQHKGGTPLQPHDLIYEMDDKPVRDLDDLQPYLDDWQQGKVALKVTYLRGENSGTAQIEIPFT